jgi:hypothetical protein
MMHELIEIRSAAATRDLVLRNLETGTVDICFDDSAVVSFDNFDFMQVGKQYECKISLFGSLGKEGIELCYLNDSMVGLRNISKATTATKDIYYVRRDCATLLSLNDSSINIGSTFTFHATRKNLIQVNDKIHGDYLESR